MAHLPSFRSLRSAFRQRTPTEASPELTIRGVALGLVIGCLLCFTNLYFGLQTGWISMMSLQSALLGFLLSRVLPTTNPLTVQENVILQTTAVATGTMPLAAGFVGIIPALGLLNPKKDGQGPMSLSLLQLMAWSCAVAFFGVFLAAPLRKQVIIKEQLVFPSGTATAQLISVIHRKPIPGPASPDLRRRGNPEGYQPIPTDVSPSNLGHAEEAIHDSTGNRDTDTDEELEDELETVEVDGWSLLGWSFTASGSMTLLAYFFPIFFNIPLFGRVAARNWLWNFSPSLSYVGQGIIMGFPTTLSMNLGMIAGWAILSPLSKAKGWAPGPVGSMEDGARGWILWVALAIMCAESVISLAPLVAEFVSAIFVWISRRYSGSRHEPSVVLRDGLSEDHDIDDEPEERLVPMAWVLWGIAGSVFGGTCIVLKIFGKTGIEIWATVIAFVIGGVLSLLGVRALGETDLNPVSGLGKIAQLAFAFLQPGNVVANIIAGGVAEAGAQQAGDLMQDLKTGHLLHASPRAQFYGQLLGSALSIVVSSVAYKLYVKAYAIPSPNFPAPTAYVWLSLARLLRNRQLPPESAKFMVYSGLLTMVISAVKLRASGKRLWWAKWVPSGVAFAIGFLNTPSFSIARMIGGIVELWYHSRRRSSPAGKADAGVSDIGLIIVASGFVLGEGVISVVGLVLKTLGVGFSCWGCSGQICPVCQ